jgi:beta-barrel assembly-enhancing protease
MNQKKRWMVLGSAALIAAAFSCAQVQRIGNQMGGPVGNIIAGSATVAQSQTLDEKDEEVYGRSLAIAITNEYPVSHDKQLIAYVNYVGETLVTVSSAPDRHYIFGVLETEKVGAFSAPNGYVFVTHGAIKLAQDEAELAGVLGHELTHVINRHGIKAVQAAMFKTGALQAASAASQIDQAMPSLNYMGDVVLRNGYDKPQENEADKGSVTLLIAAGYDPNSFLNYMKRLDATQAADEGGGLMSTHPGTHERIGAVAKQIKDSGVVGGATLKERFHAAVYPPVALAD